jgi:uncharacterized Zn-binding protein involved in type VI secretion
MSVPKPQRIVLPPSPPSWERDRVALEQQVVAATGVDPGNPVLRATSEVAGVGATYMDSVKSLADPPTTSDGRGWDQMTTGEQAAASLRKVQQTVGTALGAMGLLQDMVDVGFANLTNPLAALLPPFPAATLSMLYVGLPHAHSHPPSLIPPAPPIPLPSLGAILYGTCVRVLISGMPAARAGDLGLAPTCCGFTPFFQIKTGSSNVFIGGSRAARVLDICVACGPAEPRVASAFAKAMNVVSRVVAPALGVAADALEAAVEVSPAMAAAKAMSAGMGAAQMASDAVALAINAAMGKDPCIPPVAGPPSMGAITTGIPNVLIGGFPMVNLPDPAGPLMNALGRLKPKKPKKKPPDVTVKSCKC